MNFANELKQLHACKEAIDWVEENNYTTFEEAWGNCHRGDWMLWFANKKQVDIRLLTLAKARCVKLIIHLIKDERSREAVDVSEQYGLGQATSKVLDAAHDAAADAATDADADAYTADAYAAYAAADAAYAAYAAAADDANADATAAAAIYTADAADYDYAADGKEILKKCADICREILTDEVL